MPNENVIDKIRQYVEVGIRKSEILTIINYDRLLRYINFLKLFSLGTKDVGLLGDVGNAYFVATDEEHVGLKNDTQFDLGRIQVPAIDIIKQKFTDWETGMFLSRKQLNLISNKINDEKQNELLSEYNIIDFGKGKYIVVTDDMDTFTTRLSELVEQQAEDDKRIDELIAMLDKALAGETEELEEEPVEEKEITIESLLNLEKSIDLYTNEELSNVINEAIASGKATFEEIQYYYKNR